VKNWSIKFRIIIPLLAILIAGVLAQTVLVSVNSSSTANKISMRLAEEAVVRYANQLEWIGIGSYDIATMLETSVKALSDNGSDRQTVVDVMSKVLDRSYIMMGAWICWEPNAYDGADAEHAHAAPYEDETGRFVPYVYRDYSGGEIKFAPMKDYNDPEKSDFYLVAKNSGRLYVTDPIEYIIDGVPKILCTVSIPIFRDGVVVGVAGVDITMDSLAQKMNSEKTFNTSTVFAINSKGKVVFHPSKEILTRNYSDTWMTYFASEIDSLLGGLPSVQTLGYNTETHENVVFTGRSLNFAKSDETWIVCSITSMEDVTHPSIMLTTLIAISGTALIVVVIVIVFMIIQRSLNDLPVITGIADKLAAGEINVELDGVPQGPTDNEIGHLKKSFDRLIRSTKKQVTEVQHIADGNYTFNITPQSDRDLLNIALRDMAGSLNQMFDQATEERARAEAANETKSNFLANMSHEMRTPLNAVIGLSELALGGTDLTGDDRQNIEKVYNAGVTLLGLVNDILDLSKIEAGKLELIPVDYDTASLVNDTITLNIVRIGGKPIQFQLHIDETLPRRLLGDELRIKQICNNLLSNAFKYTEKGKVDFSVSYERDGDDVWLILSVEDTGIGIKPEDMKKLFSQYNQVDTKSNRKIEGTGLGLSIAKNLTELMDGSITVESEYGRGSIFTVKVRQRFVTDAAIGSDVAEKLKGFQYVDSIRSRNRKLVRISLPYARVLVVDDVISNLDVAKGILKPYDMQIDCVTGGPQAIELIRKAEVRYNAIFMDHMMPGMDGIEATRIIREEIGTDYARNIPILALTANAIIGNEEIFLKNGFQAFLSKPIDILAMDAAIRQWVRDPTRESAFGTDAEENAQTAAEVSATALRTIDGLDFEKGLERFNGNELVYMDILNSYVKSTSQLLEKLRDVTEDGLPDYAVTVHGIKGSSRNVGAEAIGNKAEELEHAAKSGAFDFVRANNGGFIQATEALLAELSALIRDFADSHPKERKSAPDKAVLAALKTACESFDMNGAEKAMRELESFEYEKGSELIKWLREQVYVMGFKQICERLSSEV
jgi:signal transduction histidine kinase/CheY-like chemotaxis protein/HPt (histidine-containing phosphotransfer) domain-containing protein